MMGYLLVAVAGGIAAATAALVAGQPWGSVALLYVLGGYVGLVCSVALNALHRPRQEDSALLFAGATLAWA